MSWQDWVLLGAVVVVVAAFWLARRAAGRKRIEAISTALSLAHASGYAEASLVFEQRQELAAQARAENNNIVMVGGNDRRSDGDVDRLPLSVLEWLRSGAAADVVGREGLTGGNDSRTVPVDLSIGGGPVVAGVRPGFGPPPVQGLLTEVQTPPFPPAVTVPNGDLRHAMASLIEQFEQHNDSELERSDWRDDPDDPTDH